MAVKQTDISTGGYKREFIGLSTDTKPTIDNNTGYPLGVGSTFYELDTKNGFIFDGISTWYAV